MPLRSKYADSGLSIKEIMEPVLEVVFSTGLVSRIDSCFFERQRAKTGTLENFGGLGAEDKRYFRPVTSRFLASFRPSQLEIPKVDKYPDSHRFLQKIRGAAGPPGQKCAPSLADTGQTCLIIGRSRANVNFLDPNGLEISRTGATTREYDDLGRLIATTASTGCPPQKSNPG
jgi:hypothetical protein